MLNLLTALCWGMAENICQSCFAERAATSFSFCCNVLVARGFSQGQEKVRCLKVLVVALLLSPSFCDPLSPKLTFFVLFFLRYKQCLSVGTSCQGSRDTSKAMFLSSDSPYPSFTTCHSVFSNSFVILILY